MALHKTVALAAIVVEIVNQAVAMETMHPQTAAAAVAVEQVMQMAMTVLVAMVVLELSTSFTLKHQSLGTCPAAA